MAIDMSASMFRDVTQLRCSSTPKRIRARLDGRTIADTRDALLVWEPRRVVPWYAIPATDIDLDLNPEEPAEVPNLTSPVLPPYLHNEWHTTPGRSMHLAGHGEVGFLPDDPDLGGRIVLRWEPFEWLEEDEIVVAHPRDPFKRIDVLRSDRHIRVEVGGVTVAESSRPMMLVETGLPVRWYLPRADVRMELLTASDTHSTCAYKGVASYLSMAGAPDVAWFYPDPRHDARQVEDMLCFWRPAEVYVDGDRVPTSMLGDD